MVFTSSLQIDEDKWNHVSITINKRKNTVKFTKDHFQEEMTGIDLSSLSNNNSNIFIGHSDQADSYFKGDIDNVSIYNSNVDHLNLEIKEGTFPLLNLNNVSGIVTDLSGFHSTVVNSNVGNTTNQNGYVDSAFNFDARTPSKLIVNNSNYDGYKNKNITFSAWVNPGLSNFSSLVQKMPILCKDLISGNLEFGITSDGKIYSNHS
jgi:hypothetical protein